MQLIPTLGDALAMGCKFVVAIIHRFTQGAIKGCVLRAKLGVFRQGSVGLLVVIFETCDHDAISGDQSFKDVHVLPFR